MRARGEDLRVSSVGKRAFPAQPGATNAGIHAPLAADRLRMRYNVLLLLYTFPTSIMRRPP